MEETKVKVKKHDRSRGMAAAAALLLGGFGIHKFYLGQPWLGVLYIAFFWTYIPAILGFIEFIMLMFKSDEAFDQKYNY